MAIKRTFRVYATFPRNYGQDEKVGIKLFTDRDKANDYFNKLCKEIKADSAETDDMLGVFIEDINTGDFIDEQYYEAGKEN